MLVCTWFSICRAALFKNETNINVINQWPLITKTNPGGAEGSHHAARGPDPDSQWHGHGHRQQKLHSKKGHISSYDYCCCVASNWSDCSLFCVCTNIRVFVCVKASVWWSVWSYTSPVSMMRWWTDPESQSSSSTTTTAGPSPSPPPHSCWKRYTLPCTRTHTCTHTHSRFICTSWNLTNCRLAKRTPASPSKHTNDHALCWDVNLFN